MKHIILSFTIFFSISAFAQTTLVKSSNLSNISYTLDEKGTPVPNNINSTNNMNNKNSPFIPSDIDNSTEATESTNKINQAVVQPKELLTDSKSKLPNDLKELLNGKKNNSTITENNNLRTQRINGPTLQTAPIVFSTQKGRIEDWNKTTIEEHSKLGLELAQKNYEEFLLTK